jgi:hypothetical protein
MADKSKSLEEMIKELPPDLRQTALDYIQFLYEKRVPKPKSKLKSDRVRATRDDEDVASSTEE